MNDCRIKHILDQIPKEMLEAIAEEDDIDIGVPKELIKLYLEEEDDVH